MPYVLSLLSLPLVCVHYIGSALMNSSDDAVNRMFPKDARAADTLLAHIRGFRTERADTVDKEKAAAGAIHITNNSNVSASATATSTATVIMVYIVWLLYGIV